MVELLLHPRFALPFRETLLVIPVYIVAFTFPCFYGAAASANARNIHARCSRRNIVPLIRRISSGEIMRVSAALTQVPAQQKRANEVYEFIVRRKMIQHYAN